MVRGLFQTQRLPEPVFALSATGTTRATRGTASRSSASGRWRRCGHASSCRWWFPRRGASAGIFLRTCRSRPPSIRDFRSPSPGRAGVRCRGRWSSVPWATTPMRSSRGSGRTAGGIMRWQSSITATIPAALGRIGSGGRRTTLRSTPARAFPTCVAPSVTNHWAKPVPLNGKRTIACRRPASRLKSSALRPATFLPRNAKPTGLPCSCRPKYMS